MTCIAYLIGYKSGKTTIQQFELLLMESTYAAQKTCIIKLIPFQFRFWLVVQIGDTHFVAHTRKYVRSMVIFHSILYKRYFCSLSVACEPMPLLLLNVLIEKNDGKIMNNDKRRLPHLHSIRFYWFLCVCLRFFCDISKIK